MTRNRLLTVALVLVVVGSLVAPFAMTQVQAQEDSGGNETADGGDGGGDDGAIPDIDMPEFPSGDELFRDFFGWLIEDLHDGVAGLIDQFNHVIVGVPAPGEYDDPASWASPDNNIWPYVLGVHGMSMGIAIVVLVFATMFALAMDDVKRQRRYLRQIGVSFLFGVVLGWLLLASMLHLADSLSVALAPSGEEFLSDDANFMKFGVGFVLGAALLKAKVVIVALGIFILMVIAFLIYFISATWPILWALRATPIPTLNSYGVLGITAFGLLLMLRVTQSFILRFLFQMPWSAFGPGSELISLVMIIVGLYVALYKLPQVFLEKVTIASAVGLGMGSIPSSSSILSGAPEKIKSGASRARSRASEIRGSVSRPGSTSSSTTRSRSSSTSTSTSTDGGSRSSSSSSKLSKTTGRRLNNVGTSSSHYGSNRSTELSQRRTDRASKGRSDDD